METGARGWGWMGRLRPRIFDRLLVAILFLLGLTSFIDLPFGDRPLPLPVGTPGGVVTVVVVGFLLLLLQVVPLLWRRRYPSLVLLLVAVAFGAKVLLGFTPGVAGLGLLVAMYSVSAYEVGARRLVFLIVAGLGFVAGFVVFGVTGNPRSFAITVPSVFFVAAWLIGDYLRTRRAYVAQLEERAARLEVDARVDGEAQPLPPALDLSAYRILQEATTNVLKHARARRVDIRVHYSPNMLGLDVRDDGPGEGIDPASSAGHGLIGMRERVALFGGKLHAGRDPAGGFSVHARLPIETPA